jgi:hypothetical protein
VASPESGDGDIWPALPGKSRLGVRLGVGGGAGRGDTGGGVLGSEKGMGARMAAPTPRYSGTAGPAP